MFNVFPLIAMSPHQRWNRDHLSDLVLPCSLVVNCSLFKKTLLKRKVRVNDLDKALLQSPSGLGFRRRIGDEKLMATWSNKGSNEVSN